MTQHQCLLALMAFMKQRPLALCAASPALRLTAEHSVGGYRCGAYKIQAEGYEQSSSSPMGRTMQVTIIPSVNDTLSSVEECMGWWLQRHSSVYISIQWEDYYYYQRDFTLLHPMVFMYSLKLMRCYIKDSMAWVPGCRHLQVLRLENCLSTPYCVISWIGKCLALTDLMIKECECVVDFRILAKLQHLKHLYLSTSLHIRNMTCVGMLKSLETVHIEANYPFPFENTIATLPRIRSIYIRCPHVLNIESIRRCRLLESITMHCPTFTITKETVALPRLKHLEVRSAALKHFRWLGNCRSLKSVVISDCSGITTISTILKLKNITKLDIRGIDIDRIDWIQNCSLVEDLSMGPCKRISDLSAIGTLEHLTKLRITEFKVIIIDWIKNCQFLEDLSFLNFERSIDFSPITRLPSLKRLDIRSNIITTIHWVQKCQSLDSLVIQQSKIIADFSPIGKLNRLRTLNLSYTSFRNRGWAGILRCISLQKLVVRGCLDIVDFSPIAGFEVLTTLNMSETRVADIKWIEGCKKLEYLYIAHCAHIEDFSPIGTLKKLKTVDLSYTMVVGIECMTSCSALRLVNIIGCKYISGIKPFKKRNPQVLFIREAASKEKHLAL